MAAGTRTILRGLWPDNFAVAATRLQAERTRKKDLNFNSCFHFYCEIYRDVQIFAKFWL
jgi:hypothetical protein